MAYYFAVETEKNSFNAINVKRCRHYFKTTKNYDEPLACTLKEIDNVTTTFKNEEELKKMLLKVYSIKEEDMDKPLAIFYLDGIERRLVNSNILYEDSRNMLETPTEVINYFQDLVKDNNADFFQQLATKYSDDSICKSLLYKLASLIEKNSVSNDDEQSIESLVIEVTKILINDTIINQEGLISATNKLNYEKLHVLVSFISNYQLSIKQDITQNKTKTRKKDNQ